MNIFITSGPDLDSSHAFLFFLCVSVGWEWDEVKQEREMGIQTKE